MPKLAALVLGVLLVGALTLTAARARSRARAAEHATRDAVTAPATTLGFNELFEPGAPSLRPSAKAASLVGQRVRFVGFMAQMEVPPRGAFYLTPRPVVCDEAGGGTGDLPPESVRVLMRSADGEPVPYAAGPLEATGTLEVGNATDEDGRVSAFRLHLDPTMGGAHRGAHDNEGSSR